MEKTFKLLTIILAILMILSICGCKKNSTINNSSNIASNNDTNVELSIDLSLMKEIKQSKHSNTEYTVSIPDWKYVGDYYRKSADNEFDSYHRVYQCKDDKNVYLFVGEYLGWNKIPWGQTPSNYMDACSGFSSNLLDFAFPHYFKTKLHEWCVGESSYKPVEGLPDEDRATRYTNTIIGKYFRDNDYVDGVAYVKGVCFIAGDTQVNLGLLDLTKEQKYQKELEDAVTNLAISFDYGKLVIKEEDDPFDD